MNLIERMLSAIDLEEITREVMESLIVRDLDLYFVVRAKLAGGLRSTDTYEFVGMAYSERAAKKLWLENSKAQPCNILRIDMGKLVPLIERLGAAEKII